MSQDEQIAMLRRYLYQKLTNEWDSKWKPKDEGRYGEKFVSYEGILNKKGFFEAVKEDLDELLKSKFGLVEAGERSIERDTVQRFFNPKYVSFFDKKTRDVMALYAGYSDWENFLASVTQKKQRKWATAGGIALSVVLVMGMGGYLYDKLHESMPLIDLSKVRLQIVSATNNRYAPTKIKFEYDFQGAGDYDSAFINYDNAKVRLDKAQGVIEHLYIYQTNRPIFVRLNKKGKEFLKAFPFTVKTNGWLSTGENAKGEVFNCPQYQQNGILHVLPSTISNENKQDEYYTYFDKIEDFGVTIDSCEVAIRVKNPKIEGGISCFDINLTIHGLANAQTTSFSTNLLHPSCAQFSAIRFNDFVWGYDHILKKPVSSLMGMTAYVEDWQLFRVRFKDERCWIFLDDKLLKTFRYKTSLGKMKQVTIGFKGSGSVDFVKISSSHSGKTILFDDF